MSAACHLGGSSNGSARATDATGLSVRVEATRLLVERPDGSVVSPDELIGAVIVARDPDGSSRRIRIDAIDFEDPEDPDSTWRYGFATQLPGVSQWENPCPPGPDGRRQGTLYRGFWRDGTFVESASEISIACSAGTVGKCIEMGYLPGSEHEETGTDLRAYHQTCVRLLRADYCGDGVAHTRNGTVVELFDDLAIQVDTSAPGLHFEASWNEHGAVCIERLRIPEPASLEYVEHVCPGRLARNHTDARCPSGLGPAAMGARMINRSAEP